MFFTDYAGFAADMILQTGTLEQICDAYKISINQSFFIRAQPEYKAAEKKIQAELDKYGSNGPTVLKSRAVLDAVLKEMTKRISRCDDVPFRDLTVAAKELAKLGAPDLQSLQPNSNTSGLTLVVSGVSGLEHLTQK